MTKIKLCGLSRPEDIAVANEIVPDYIGFVFAKKSRRHVSKHEAADLKTLLKPGIEAVGVFVDEEVRMVAELLNDKIIDVAQLHGSEDEAYIGQLRALTDACIIKAFKISTREDVQKAIKSSADYILLDSGAGDGLAFDWEMIGTIERPYFLAGGLDCDNVSDAVKKLDPFAVDVSSGIETDGCKDARKMDKFVSTVRNLSGKDKT